MVYNSLRQIRNPLSSRPHLLVSQPPLPDLKLTHSIEALALVDLYGDQIAARGERNDDLFSPRLLHRKLLAELGRGRGTGPTISRLDRGLHRLLSTEGGDPHKGHTRS